MKELDIIKIRKWGILLIASIFFALFIFYYAAGESLHYNPVMSDMLSGTDVIGELVDGNEIQQKIYPTTDYIEGITLFVGTYARNNSGIMNVTIVEEDNESVISSKKVDISKLKDNEKYKVTFDDLIEVEKNKAYLIKITTENCTFGNAVTLYYNSVDTTLDNRFYMNGNQLNGELCLSLNGKDANWFGKVYWSFAGGVLLIALVYYLHTISKFKKGKKGKIIQLVETFIKYRFLIKQLISRDFKTKYKRSVLGFLWSFLNPLLTMLVQYIVFSKLFKSDIDNYPIYLLSAGIVFNFFTESVGQGLGSIVSNASLITKVYIPKYIYPVSKVLSTSINMFISLVPLFLAVLITGERITVSYLVLPFLFITLIIFCIGMSFMLSAAMVFFRDTQFLWGIISLLWMYATPIFYPEAIIPESFSLILKLNPMYHFIKFFRIVLLQGIAPQPVEFLYCGVFALLFFIIGNIIFQKSQKKFVLYI